MGHFTQFHCKNTSNFRVIYHFTQKSVIKSEICNSGVISGWSDWSHWSDVARAVQLENLMTRLLVNLSTRPLVNSSTRQLVHSSTKKINVKKEIFIPKKFAGMKKCRTFAPANRVTKDCDGSKRLGYGVMVTLQILVLSFLVRVRVPQQINPLSH